MSYIIIVIGLLIIGMIYTKSNPFSDWILMCNIVLGVILFSMILISSIAQFVEFPVFKAKYDTVKEMIQTVSPAASEDMVGQISELNMFLAQAKKLNVLHFFDPYISDRFMDLEPIEIPPHLRK